MRTILSRLLVKQIPVLSHRRCSTASQVLPISSRPPPPLSTLSTLSLSTTRQPVYVLYITRHETPVYRTPTEITLPGIPYIHITQYTTASASGARLAAIFAVGATQFAPPSSYYNTSPNQIWGKRETTRERGRRNRDKIDCWKRGHSPRIYRLAYALQQPSN